MAIVTISKIQHRRGIVGSDPMPQLAGAELGWAIDNQELFIGNSTIANGAPTEGNTRILTEHSDLIALLSDYTYSGPFNGAVMQTGADIATPVSRSFVDRFNDSANVRGHGAVGDGIIDDIEALERIIFQHTLNQPTNQSYWTTIYVPAGVYRISRPLRLPSHVRLVGDGFNSTKIVLDVSAPSILSVEKMQDPSTFGDVFPTDIYVAGIQFESTQAVAHGLVMGDARNVFFEHCAFLCASTDTTVLGTNNVTVLFNNQLRSSSQIRFLNCKFSKATYGFSTGSVDGNSSRQDIKGVLVQNCEFDNMYKGAQVGVTVNATFGHPSNIRFINNTFDHITKEGIHCSKTSKTISSNNHFADVGNNQIGVASANVIIFGDFGATDPLNTPIDLADYEGNYSMGDTFDRSDADDLLFERIKSSCLNSYIIDSKGIRFGTLQTEPGRLFMLADATLAPASTGIVLPANKYSGAVIDYQLVRGDDQQRTGTINISQGLTANSFNEEYNEVTPVGVTFSAAFNAGVSTIEYTSSIESRNIVFSYGIRHLSCPAAIPSIPIDITPPTIEITSPTNLTTFDTTAATVDISGVANDLYGVITVTWSVDTGAAGTATGTDTWSQTGIPLVAGDNIITVTATDSNGNTSTDVITVTYTVNTGEVCHPISNVTTDGLNWLVYVAGDVTATYPNGASAGYEVLIKDAANVVLLTTGVGSAGIVYQAGNLATLIPLTESSLNPFPAGAVTICVTNQLAPVIVAPGSLPPAGP